jgi:hypothetical protein
MGLDLLGEFDGNVRDSQKVSSVTKRASLHHFLPSIDPVLEPIQY